MPRWSNDIVSPLGWRLRPRRCDPTGLVVISVMVVFTILANVEYDASAFDRVAFGKVYSVWDADVAEVLVVVDDGETGVIVAREIGYNVPLFGRFVAATVDLNGICLLR